MGANVPRVRSDHSVTFIGPQGSSDYLDEWSFQGLLSTESHWRLRSGAWSGGGPFYVWKRRISHGASFKFWVKIGFGPPWFVDNEWTCKGAATIEAHMPSDLLVQAQIARASAKSQLPLSYASAYARARPGNPIASAGQFLAELRDLPSRPFKGYFGQLLRSRNPARTALRLLTDFRRLGSEYLNVAFGWKPFVRDLQAMYRYMKEVNATIAKLREENGRGIRRHHVIRNDKDVSESKQVYTYPYANVYGGAPSYPAGTTTFTRRTETHVKEWFVGKFRYYIPNVDSWQWEAKARLALFGALPTPDLLWELLPWSWMIDWFSNVGDVIKNHTLDHFGAVENLTCKYSFIMRETTTKTTVSAAVNHGASSGYYNWPECNHTFESVDETVEKCRMGGGDPYGINVSFPSLTTGQLAILGALGLSRSKFTGVRL